jgi:hypothetical protein
MNPSDLLGPPFVVLNDTLGAALPLALAVVWFFIAINIFRRLLRWVNEERW